MKAYEKDTTAGAVFLMNFGQMKVFSGNKPKYQVKYYYRIKLVDKKAFELADVELAFFGKKKVEKITDLQAKITNPNGVEITLKKKDFIEEKMGDFIKSIKFTFPKVMEGSILEYEYTLISQDLFQPRDWYFQFDYPSKWSELRINLPDDVAYACVPKAIPSMNNLSQRASDGTIIYRLLDVAGFKAEPFVTNLEDHYAKLIFQLDQFGRSYFISSWGTLAGELLLNRNFSRQYLVEANYQEMLKEITPLVKEASTPIDIIEKIYEHLSKELIWNGNYSKGMNQTVDELYQKKRGSSGGLNLTMIAALRGFNITAYPVLVSTRSNGEMDAQYPIINQFNHILVNVPLDEKNLIIDVTDSLHPIDFPKIDALNYRGWMVTDYEPEWISIGFPTTIDVMKADLTLAKDGLVVGNIKCLSNGYSAINDRKLLIEENEENFWEERFQMAGIDVEIDTVFFDNINNIDKTLASNMEIKVTGMATMNENFVYFSPFLYTRFTENPFKSPVRKYNVDFPYPFKEHYSLQLAIPRNYEIEEIPKSVHIYLRDRGATFKYVLTKKEHSLNLTSSISIKQAQYTPDEYYALKDFFDQIAAKFREQIVLKKR